MKQTGLRPQWFHRRDENGVLRKYVTWYDKDNNEVGTVFWGFMPAANPSAPDFPSGEIEEVD